MTDNSGENSNELKIDGDATPPEGGNAPIAPENSEAPNAPQSSDGATQASAEQKSESSKAKAKSDGEEEEVPNDVVLVVDDSQPNRKIVRAALEKHRIPVIESSDGKHAEDRFKAHQDKVMAIISDINMPGQDGVELLEVVRQLKAEIPFILITGEPFADRIKRARELKVSAIIVKPLTSQVIIEKLAQALPNKVRSR